MELQFKDLTRLFVGALLVSGMAAVAGAQGGGNDFGASRGTPGAGASEFDSGSSSGATAPSETETYYEESVSGSTRSGVGATPSRTPMGSSSGATSESYPGESSEFSESTYSESTSKAVDGGSNQRVEKKAQKKKSSTSSTTRKASPSPKGSPHM